MRKLYGMVFLVVSSMALPVTSYTMGIVSFLKGCNSEAPDSERNIVGDAFRLYAKMTGDEQTEKSIAGIGSRDEAEKTIKIYADVAQNLEKLDKIEDSLANQYEYRVWVATKRAIKIYNDLCKFMKSSDQSKDAVQQTGAILATTLTDAQQLLTQSRSAIPVNLAEGIDRLIADSQIRSAKLINSTTSSNLSTSSSRVSNSAASGYARPLGNSLTRINVSTSPTTIARSDSSTDLINRSQQEDDNFINPEEEN